MRQVRTSGAILRWKGASMGVLLSLVGCAVSEPDQPPGVTAAALVTNPEPDADAPFAGQAPVIDGVIGNSEVWRDAQVNHVSRLIAGKAPPPWRSAADWRAVWDESALYVFVTVEDAQRYNDSALPWEDDSIELYIDGSDSKLDRYTSNDYQFIFGFGDATVVEANGKSVEGISFAQRTDGVIYQMEIRIPWLHVFGLEARDWRRIGFDVHVNDDDDGGARDRKFSWHSPVDSSWTDPRTFGTLRLLPDGPPVCTPRDGDDPFTIVYAPETPIFDAREDPSGVYGWSSLGSSTALIAGTSSGPDDLSASWKFVWNDGFLYMVAFVTDDQLRNDSDYPWEDDSVELYLNGDESQDPFYGPDDYQFVFSWNDDTVVEAHGKSTAGVHAITTTVPGGYRLEALVPMALFKPDWFGPGWELGRQGTRFSFDVHVNDDDDGGARDGKVSWAALEDRSWTDPSLDRPAQLVRCE